MNIHTDIKTLSRLYPLFEKAGLAGVLTGDLQEIESLTYPQLCAALLKGGDLPEICQIITGSENFIADNQESKPFHEASREEALGVIVPFLIDITVGPLKLPELSPESQNQATSS